jgi:hypothetical protein
LQRKFLRPKAAIEVTKEEAHWQKKKLEEKTEKTKARNKKRYDKVKALRAKYGDEKSHLFQNWTTAECSSYLQYKKKKGDPGSRIDVPSISTFDAVPQ